jgi:hypothetical protein
VLGDQAEQIVIGFGRLTRQFVEHVGLRVGVQNQANLLIPRRIDVVEFLSAFVNELLDHAALLVEAHLRDCRGFQRIQHAKKVLAFAENDLRGARRRTFGLRLHQIGASHRYLTQ